MALFYWFVVGKWSMCWWLLPISVWITLPIVCFSTGLTQDVAHMDLQTTLTLNNVLSIFVFFVDAHSKNFCGLDSFFLTVYQMFIRFIRISVCLMRLLKPPPRSVYDGSRKIIVCCIRWLLFDGWHGWDRLDYGCRKIIIFSSVNYIDGPQLS